MVVRFRLTAFFKYPESNLLQEMLPIRLTVIKAKVNNPLNYWMKLRNKLLNMSGHDFLPDAFPSTLTVGLIAAFLCRLRFWSTFHSSEAKADDDIYIITTLTSDCKRKLWSSSIYNFSITLLSLNFNAFRFPFFLYFYTFLYLSLLVCGRVTSQETVNDYRFSITNLAK